VLIGTLSLFVLFLLGAFVSQIGGTINLWLVTQVSFWSCLVVLFGGAAMVTSKRYSGLNRISIIWVTLSGLALLVFVVSFLAGVFGGFWAWDVRQRQIVIEYERAHPTPKPAPRADPDAAKRVALHNYAFAINTRSGTNVVQALKSSMTLNSRIKPHRLK